MKITYSKKFTGFDKFLENLPMKKRHGIHRALEVIPASQLSNMSTGALLARLKRLHWCYETPDAANDLTEDERQSVAHKILFKSDPRWKVAYQDMKTILATREHKANI